MIQSGVEKRSSRGAHNAENAGSSPASANRPAVAIQHHPKRAGLLDRLTAGLSGLRVEVVSDPDPTGDPSAWRTYRKCLEHAPAWATHHVILQDDARVCRDFGFELEMALIERGDHLCVLHTGRTPELTAINAGQAIDRGEHWSIGEFGTPWVSCVALAWPVWLIPIFLGWVDQATWYAPVGDDQAVGRWVNAMHIPVWHRVPSLVEHPDDVPSMIPGQRINTEHRKAIYPPAHLV